MDSGASIIEKLKGQVVHITIIVTGWGDVFGEVREIFEIPTFKPLITDVKDLGRNGYKCFTVMSPAHRYGGSKFERYLEKVNKTVLKFNSMEIPDHMVQIQVVTVPEKMPEISEVMINRTGYGD